MAMKKKNNHVSERIQGGKVEKGGRELEKAKTTTQGVRGKGSRQKKRTSNNCPK